MQIIVFELGGERYAVETSQVKGINKMIELTPVPCAPSYIEGLINLRGSVISVFNPYIILNISNGMSQSNNIIIIDVKDETIGMLVDRVTEVVDIDGSLVKNVSISKDDDVKYIKGTANMGDYLVTLIDINLMLDEKIAS